MYVEGLFFIKENMKKLSSMIGLAALFLMLFSLIGTAQANMAMPYYDYAVEARSEDARIKQGEQVILWVTLKNTGNETWHTGLDGIGVMHLGTSNPKDRTSQFFTLSNWITTNRVNDGDEEMANRNENMSFGWYMTAPANIIPGIYQECFAPVVENVTWMREDGRLCWNIYVEENNNLLNGYQAEIDWNMANQTVEVAPNGTAKVTFSARNNGSATWYQEGQYPIHLATYDPADRESYFVYVSNWLAYNRPARLDQEMVKPGEIGTFTFSIKAPDWVNPGSKYVEKFWLVAENMTWLGVRALDSGSAWFTLNINAVEDTNANMEKSTLKADKEVFKGDGKEEVKITVTIKNNSGEALPDQSVELYGKGCDIDPDKGCWSIDIDKKLTNQQGQAIFSLTHKGEANFKINYIQISACLNLGALKA